MRNMSFAITTAQVRAQTKDVTRRVGWHNLKAGDLIQPVVKGMGLRKGEKVEKIGGPVRILSTRVELLGHMTNYPNDGMTETRREGFPEMTPRQFIEMFCEANRACTPLHDVTRIEFSYDLLDGWEAMPSAPKDGSQIELLIRHTSWHYEVPAKRDQWQGPCRASWTDFNGGGWTWSGHMGTPIAWRVA